MERFSIKQNKKKKDHERINECKHVRRGEGEGGGEVWGMNLGRDKRDKDKDK